ncbi:hypothetical protein [Streptomyces sp. NPDC088400]|uniref:hypothetical protein n=1 Tax=Streptomyces sp. NPDC088400 TaxID=3365861 RepID=UPI0038118F0B
MAIKLTDELIQLDSEDWAEQQVGALRGPVRTAAVAKQLREEISQFTPTSLTLPH